MLNDTKYLIIICLISSPNKLPKPLENIHKSVLNEILFTWFLPIKKNVDCSTRANGVNKKDGNKLQMSLIYIYISEPLWSSVETIIASYLQRNIYTFFYMDGCNCSR